MIIIFNPQDWYAYKILFDEKPFECTYLTFKYNLRTLKERKHPTSRCMGKPRSFRTFLFFMVIWLWNQKKGLECIERTLKLNATCSVSLCNASFFQTTETCKLTIYWNSEYLLKNKQFLCTVRTWKSTIQMWKEKVHEVKKKKVLGKKRKTDVMIT